MLAFYNRLLSVHKTSYEANSIEEVIIKLIEAINDFNYPLNESALKVRGTETEITIEQLLLNLFEKFLSQQENILDAALRFFAKMINEILIDDPEIVKLIFKAINNINVKRQQSLIDEILTEVTTKKKKNLEEQELLETQAVSNAQKLLPELSEELLAVKALSECQSSLEILLKIQTLLEAQTLKDTKKLVLARNEKLDIYLDRINDIINHEFDPEKLRKNQVKIEQMILKIKGLKKSDFSDMESTIADPLMTQLILLESNVIYFKLVDSDYYIEMLKMALENQKISIFKFLCDFYLKQKSLEYQSHMSVLWMNKDSDQVAISQNLQQNKSLLAIKLLSIIKAIKDMISLQLVEHIRLYVQGNDEANNLLDQIQMAKGTFDLGLLRRRSLSMMQSVGSTAATTATEMTRTVVSAPSSAAGAISGPIINTTAKTVVQTTEIAQEAAVGVAETAINAPSTLAANVLMVAGGLASIAAIVGEQASKTASGIAATIGEIVEGTSPDANQTDATSNSSALNLMRRGPGH